jgi:hypothetical protein
MKIIYLHSLLLSVGGILGQRYLTLPVFGRNPGKFQKLQFIKGIRAWNTFAVFVALLLAFQPYLVSQVSAQEKTADVEKIERLERLIRAQQQQLELLLQQVNELKHTAADAQAEAKEAKSMAEDIESRVDPVATAKASDVQAPAEKIVTSGGGERTKLSINGFVNRMVNIVDDGKDTDAYFVDNDNAESRVNFVGTAKVNDDLTLGGRIELAIAPNKSGNVNQLDQEIDNIFSQRWTEASLLSKRFGKPVMTRLQMSGSVMPSIILTACFEKTGSAMTRPHSMDSTSLPRLSASSAMTGLCFGGGRAMASRPPPVRASLIPTGTIRAFNTAAPFQFCTKTPV